MKKFLTGRLSNPSGSIKVEAVYSPQTNGSGFQPILVIGDDPPAVPFVAFGVVNLQPRLQVGNDARVDLCHRARDGVQPRVGITKDVEQGHLKTRRDASKTVPVALSAALSFAVSCASRAARDRRHGMREGGPVSSGHQRFMGRIREKVRAFAKRFALWCDAADERLYIWRDCGTRAGLQGPPGA